MKFPSVKNIWSLLTHPVVGFLVFDWVLRAWPLVYVDRGLIEYPLGLWFIPGFLVSLASDGILAFALWHFFATETRLARDTGGSWWPGRVMAVFRTVAVFAGLALIISDGLVYAVSARHLNQIPVNNTGIEALAYILKIPQYQMVLTGGLATVAVLQWLLTRMARQAIGRRRESNFPGSVRDAVQLRAAVIAVSVMASVAVAQLAKDGNSRPITAIASSLADRLFTRTGPDARAQEPTRARVELTTAELDMVASVGLPAYPRRPAGAGLRELPPKIVLITVESLARNLVRKFHVPGPGFTMPDWATPNLDRLAGGRAVSFNAHGTTMMPTQPGLYTTLLSRSVLHDHEVAPKDHRPLAEVLKESGYEASFFQGAEITYGRISYYSPKIFRHEFSKGFHEIVSSGFSGDHSWGWGLHDDVVFDAAWQFLARDLKKRQFVHILTVDTHPPFGSEQEFADAPAGFRRADPMVRALYATDRAIGRLMDRMESSGLIANGALVIVTADHSPSHMYSQYMPENPRMLNDLIPLFVWHRDLDPAAIPAAVTSRMSSQVDVAPTVLELSGLEIPRSYAGRNLFDPATTPLWVSNEDPIGNKAQVVELNMPDRKIRVPTVGPVVKGTSPGDPHTDTDVALVSALQKWFVFKHQESKGESRVVGVQPEVRRREAVVREYPGGVRIVRPANGVYLPRIDELWAGGPIVFDGRQRQGVVVRVTSSIFVDLPPGTRHLKCQLGVIPSREKIHASPGQFEWHVMAKGKKISVVQMPVDRDAVRDLKVSVPAGVQRLEIKFMRVGTGDRKIGYDEGYIGEIQAVR